MFDDDLDDDERNTISEYSPDDVSEYAPDDGSISDSDYDAFNTKKYSTEKDNEPEEFDPDDNDSFQNPSFTEYGNNDNDAGGNQESDSLENDESDSDNDDRSSDDQQEIDDNDDEEKDPLNFYERKISPAEAEKRTTQPKQINKRLLSVIIICVVGGIFLVAFLMPTQSQKKAAEDATKKIASKVNLSNYEAMAKRQGQSSSGQPPVAQEPEIDVGKFKNEYDENGNIIIPPVIVEETKPAYDQTKAYTTTGGGGGGGSTVQIPDTRNDSLQEKRISGIKGLSSTQQTYSTNYAEQVEKNVASTQRTNSYTMPSQQEYMNTMLNAYSNVYGNSNNNANNAYSLQNDQAGKNSFYNNGRNSSSVGQGQWLDYNTIWQGTIIEAVLTSELNTDLPGEITARVAKNVYSSQDGRYLLIPQNSVLYGSYNSSISYAQSRVQVGWHTLIRPDGYQVSLGNMNATDAKGASGLKGFVNDHPLAYLKALGLMSVFSVVNSEFNATLGQTNNEYIQGIMANTQQITNELGDKLIDRAMNVQPTIKIKAGTKINVLANQTMALPPYEEIPVTQAYRKY